MGAWIETDDPDDTDTSYMSRPVWARGLKHKCFTLASARSGVAPRVGAWIETISCSPRLANSGKVAPRVGAWIETQYYRDETLDPEVAPRVGAWIETA